MDRYICIHGHFYQPPRENPWLETIELQDSAYPYHDWNERITAECYGPNAASRILDGSGKIVRIVNNYARISFNFGPTLLSWLATNARDVYEAVLAADQESQLQFSGHGSAMAQAYNHMILPLANPRDRRTQILWGLRDFEFRFRRQPEGMWLAETAVDLDSLDVMAECGIRFTVLAPHQARRVRPFGARRWTDVRNARIDPSMPYQIQLPSGRTMNLFFYDGPISRAVAFEKLLIKGEYFTERLMGGFSDARKHPQIMHIATDGETYGHHSPHGDMALAYALHRIESENLARLTNYGEFLEKHPPTHEVRIYPNSSWSCVHGVARWASDCGCNSGMNPGWHQQWRAPLREALDWLRDTLIPAFQKRGRELFTDPWEARDDYIAVLLDRSPKSVDRFLASHARRALAAEEGVEALKLLEMQRHAMLMYTSCGWFFDELSGIETVQVIQYAGRALQLYQNLFGDHVEAEFLRRLSAAKSNLPEHGDGQRIYEKFVRPAIVDLTKVGAHYAVSSVFETYDAETDMDAFRIQREDYRLRSSGKARLVLGRARVESKITRESARVTFGVLYLGDLDVRGGVREFRGEEAYEQLCRSVTESFERSDFAETTRIVESDFGSETYTLQLLFRDEQRRIVRMILESALEEAEASYRQMYDRYSPLLAFLTAQNMPVPRRMLAAAEFTLNAGIRHALEAERLDFELLRARVEEARRFHVPLDRATLEFALRKRVDALARAFDEQPDELGALQALDAITGFARSLPFEVNLWLPQNVFFRIRQDRYQERLARAGEGDENAAAWCEQFRALGEKLMVQVG